MTKQVSSKDAAPSPDQRQLLLREAESLLKGLIAQGKARGAERGYFFASAAENRVAVIDCTDAFSRLFGYNLREEILELKDGLYDVIPADLDSDNLAFYQELRQLANTHRITQDTFFLTATKKDGTSITIALVIAAGSAMEPYSRLLGLHDFNTDAIRELFYSTVIFGGMAIKIDEVGRSNNVVPFVR